MDEHRVDILPEKNRLHVVLLIVQCRQPEVELMRPDLVDDVCRRAFGQLDIEIIINAIDLSVERMEWGAFLDRTGQGDQEMYLLGWTTVTVDADYGLYALHNSDNFGAVGNRSFFGNDELDEALDNGRTESDEEARADAYSTAQEIITEEAPIAPIVHSNFSICVDTSQVEGVELDALGDVRLENVTFKE